MPCERVCACVCVCVRVCVRVWCVGVRGVRVVPPAHWRPAPHGHQLGGFGEAGHSRSRRRDAAGMDLRLVTLVLSWRLCVRSAQDPRQRVTPHVPRTRRCRRIRICMCTTRAAAADVRQAGAGLDLSGYRLLYSVSAVYFYTKLLYARRRHGPAYSTCSSRVRRVRRVVGESGESGE